jgi:DNA repair protein RecO (recombination protein O)
VALVKDLGVVLRRLDYSETSQVLAVLTREHGQQRMIAKGIKRSTKTRVAVGVDLLELGDVVFSRRPGKEDVLGILTEWRQLDTHPHLRRDLTRWYAAQYAAEVTAQLTEIHDPHAGLFDSLRHLLEVLSAAPALPALCTYLWRMFTEIGLRPELSACMACNRQLDNETVLYFSSREGGAICRECEGALVEKRRIDPTAAHALVQRNEDLPERCAPQAFDILDYHVTETMARPPRLAEPLRRALGLDGGRKR